MNPYKINRWCYMAAMGCIVAAATLGLSAIWVDAIWNSPLMPRCWYSIGLLFVTSFAGVSVTYLLTPEMKNDRT